MFQKIYNRRLGKMTKRFDKNLAAFLTEARESAINELKDSNGEYQKLCHVLSEKMRIAKELPDEYTDIVESLVDTMFALSRLEKNYLYLQGFKDCVNLHKRLDGSFIESQEFEKLFME